MKNWQDNDAFFFLLEWSNLMIITVDDHLKKNLASSLASGCVQRQKKIVSMQWNHAGFSNSAFTPKVPSPAVT